MIGPRDEVVIGMAELIRAGEPFVLATVVRTVAAVGGQARRQGADPGRRLDDRLDRRRLHPERGRAGGASDTQRRAGAADPHPAARRRRTGGP